MCCNNVGLIYPGSSKWSRFVGYSGFHKERDEEKIHVPGSLNYLPIEFLGSFYNRLPTQTSAIQSFYGR